MNADLHNHTKASDGEYTPAQLVDAAEKLGIKRIGITDHDTLSGIVEAMSREETKPDLSVVTGVEVSLRFRRDFFVGTLHYLVYVPRDLALDKLFLADADVALAHARGPALNRARVDAINACYGPRGTVRSVLSTPLSVEEVEKLAPNVTRRHFSIALKSRGLDEPTVMELIGNSSPAYIPSGMELSDLSPLIKKYPRLVRVLAHPAAGSFPGEGVYKEVLPPVETVERLLPEIDTVLGIDGLEVHYPGHTQELRERVLGWTREKPFLVTGGSDCHDTAVRRLGTGGIDAGLAEIFLSRLH